LTAKQNSTERNTPIDTKKYIGYVELDIADITAVRLKIEQNQLVRVPEQICVHVEWLKCL